VAWFVDRSRIRICATTPLGPVTIPTHSAEPAPKPPARPEKLSLSLTQIIASVLAAISATVVASFFGVAGTVIGAGLGSLISVVGGSVYAHSLTRTRDRIRTAAVESAVAQRFGLPATAVHTAAESAPAGPKRPSAPDSQARARTARMTERTWFGMAPKRLILTAGALFAVTIAAVTGFELLSGQPLSSTVTDRQGSGTSIGGGQRDTHPPKTPPAVTPTSVRTTPHTPTTGPSSAAATGSGSASSTTSPSPAASESTSAPPTGSPSSAPSTPTDSVAATPGDANSASVAPSG
jgi:hypothetical protein